MRDLIAKGFAPLPIRYLLVSVPYRKQLNFTFDGLHQAEQSLDRIKEFLFRLKSSPLHPGNDVDAEQAIRDTRERFESAMDDDLNTAQALAALFDLIRTTNRLLDEGKLRIENKKSIEDWISDVDDRIGIIPPSDNEQGFDIEVENLIEQRNQARVDRNFGLADEIRQRLLEKNVVVEDEKDGTRWRYK